MTSVEPPKKKLPEPDPKEQPKEEKKIMSRDFYYPANYIENPLADSSISKHCFEFQFHLLIFPSTKKLNKIFYFMK